MSDLSEPTGRSDLITDMERFETLSAESKKAFFSTASALCHGRSSNSEAGPDDRDGGLWNDLRCRALASLDDDSPDVRRTAGVFLGDLGKSFGSDVYAKSKRHIYERLAALVEENEANSVLGESQASSIVKSIYSRKHLDSWICCLEKMMTGVGVDVCKEVDAELLQLLLRCLDCRDMYLEQDCMRLLHALLRDCRLHVHLKSLDRKGSDREEMAVATTWALIKGMASPSPGTRYESCKAIREMLLAEGNLERADYDLVDKLIPTIWFNRYSKENGLRELCQETWVELTAGRGRQLVEAHLQASLDYCYLGLVRHPTSPDTINSCHCLSEVVRKLDRHLMDPLVDQMYERVKPLALNAQTDRQTLDAVCLLLAEMVSRFSDLMERHLAELMEMSEGLQNHQSTNVLDSSALLFSRLVEHYGPEKSNLPETLDKMERSLRDFASDDGEKPPLKPVAEELPTVLEDYAVAFRIERKCDAWGTTHEIQPLQTEQRTHEVFHPVYGWYCLLVHLLPILPSLSLPDECLFGQIRSTLETATRLRLHELSALMVSRLPELFDSLAKLKRKRLLEELLAAIVEMCRQEDSARLRGESLSLLEKLRLMFGPGLVGAKLVSIDKDFAAKFEAERP